MGYFHVVGNIYADTIWNDHLQLCIFNNCHVRGTVNQHVWMEVSRWSGSLKCLDNYFTIVKRHFVNEEEYQFKYLHVSFYKIETHFIILKNKNKK